jgi:hypothetical protein
MLRTSRSIDFRTFKALGPELPTTLLALANEVRWSNGIWAQRSSADVGEDASSFPQFGITSTRAKVSSKRSARMRKRGNDRSQVLAILILIATVAAGAAEPIAPGAIDVIDGGYDPGARPLGSACWLCCP